MFVICSVLALGALVEIRVALDLPRAFSVARIPVYGLVLHFLGYLAYSLERLLVPSEFLAAERRRRISYVAILHLLVVLSFLSAMGLYLPGILLALVLIMVRCGLFVAYEKSEGLSASRRRDLWEMAGTWVLWSSTMLVYLFLVFEDGYTGLIWDKADARHYHWLSNELLTFELEPSFFPLGLSLFLAPLNLLLGTFTSTDLGSLARLNGASMVFLAFVVSPAALVLLGRTCRAVLLPSGWRRSRWSSSMWPVLIALVLAYAVWFQPDFVSVRDAKYHPIMMFGLTPAVEPLSFLFSAIVLYFVSDLGRFPVVPAGAFLGMSVLVKETNALIGLVLVVFLWVAGERVRRIAVLGAVSAAVYAVQVAHNAALHGSIFAANRSYQWDLMAHRWVDYVHDHYGIAFLGSDPPRLSPAYVSANTESFISSYWLAIALLAIAWLLLVRTGVRIAFVVTFAAAVMASFTLLHLGYLRSGAIFRYLHTVLPMAMFLFVGLGSAVPRYSSLFRRRVHDALV